MGAGIEGTPAEGVHTRRGSGPAEAVAVIRGSLTTLQVLKPRTAEGRPVVRKRLREGLSDDPWLQGLLESVGHLGMRIATPHVVRTLALKGAPDSFVALDYVDGASLANLLTLSHGRDVTRYVVPVLLDVLAGLTALHEMRAPGGEATPVVHQAPSARHMLVGTDGRARLCDLLHVSAPGLAPSAERQRFLVPAEMSPEQASGNGHIDARCDVFIVGAVLWEALTGEHLFAASTPQEALARVLRMPIVAPSQHGTSSFFDAVCARALMRVRVGRYGSAEEMASDLRDAAQARGLCASHEEVADWVLRTTGRSEDKPRESHTLLKPLFASEREIPNEPSVVKATPSAFKSSFFDEPATEARPSLAELAQESAHESSGESVGPDSVPLPTFRHDRDEREPELEDPTRPRVISAVFGGPISSVLSDAPAWVEEVIQGGPEPTLESLRAIDDRQVRRGWLMGAFVGASTVAILYALYTLAFGAPERLPSVVVERAVQPKPAISAQAAPTAEAPPPQAKSAPPEPASAPRSAVAPAASPSPAHPVAPVAVRPQAAPAAPPRARAAAVAPHSPARGVPENPY